MNTLIMSDKSSASLRWVDGRCQITYHAISKVLILPVAIQPTINLVSKLYIALKGA